MKNKGLKGSITVFLSLACVLFLALICAVTESARVQGAKAQTANITGMGTFSLLGEFEKDLLETYELFALDGAYGSGSFQIQKVNERFASYLRRNTEPKSGLISVLSFDPWNLSVQECEITGYTLLTDSKGEAFYQQAVSFMKANMGFAAAEKLMQYAEDAKELTKRQEEYEKNKQKNEEALSGLEEQRQEKLEVLESEALEAGLQTEAPQKTNPLTEIAKLRKKSTLEIVTWDKKISEESIKLTSQPSRSRLKKGNLSIEKEHSGTASNVLFREYLLQYFPNYAEQESGAGLNYQLEYILGGKASDKNNLKYVVNRLLLMREGMNYLCCVQDSQMNTQAGGLAVTLTGFLGMPALTAATKHALLLAWAYGESLVDLRILLDGGKVPIWKSSASWSLTLENLGRVTEVLKNGAKGKDKGLAYRDYLRILLSLSSLSNQKMRALDLIQAEIRAKEGMKGFRVNHCIVAVETRAEYRCGQVFLGFPRAVLGTASGDTAFTQKAGMSYQ